MAYSGTTSTSPNPPNMLSSFMGSTFGGGLRVWYYRSTNALHVGGAESSTGFFTDGELLGMTLGDPIFVIGSTTFLMSAHAVNVVTSTGVGLSAGLIVSSAS